MGTLNPVENRVIGTINENSKQLKALQKSRQPYQGDWFEFNISSFSYISNNVIAVDPSIPVENFFQMGDKVRINQTAYKYFYVIKVDTPLNRLTLDAGAVYTFDNTTFTTFGISRLSNPLGHPLIFDFSNNLKVYCYDGSYHDDTANFQVIYGAYSMIGCIATISYDIYSIANMRAGAFIVLFYSPFKDRPQIQNSGGNETLTAGSVTTTGFFQISTLWESFAGGPPIAAGEVGIGIEALRVNAYPFASGEWGVNFTVTVGV